MPRFDALLPATTASADATEALGRALAAHLRPGDVVALDGDLGAGKTHLVRGLVAGLGGDASDVSSPTFTLVHAYATPRGPVHHVDAYRLDGPDDFRRVGGDEVLDDASAVVLVEWPSRIAALLPPETLRLRLSHLGSDARRVEEAG